MKMGNETKEGAVGRITLRVTNYSFDDLTYRCALCGHGYDVDRIGFYYFIGDTESCVCDLCAKEQAPELVAIRREALSVACLAASRLAKSIRGKIEDVIKEPLEERIMKVLDEICEAADGRFQKSNMG
jgi:hypothetical protein